MESACSVLDMILIHLELYFKDMSFEKQDASDVTDQQLCFVIILGFCFQERRCYKINKYASLVRGT